MGVDEFCHSAVPEFERELAEASAQLPQRKIVIRAEGDRAPSSVGSSTLTEEDKERWRTWSEERLTEIQNSLDVVADNPEMAPVRRELSSAADQAVALYGFATAGNTEKMRESLGTLDQMLAEVKRKVCPAPFRQ